MSNVLKWKGLFVTNYRYLNDNYFHIIILVIFMKKIVLLLIISILFPVKVFAYNLGESAILMEEDTKRVLVSKSMNKKMLIASTTKIMTAVIAIESGKTEKMVKVTDKVLEAYGSAIYLSIGEKMKLEDMVYGLMMQSGNELA